MNECKLLESFTIYYIKIYKVSLSYSTLFMLMYRIRFYHEVYLYQYYGTERYQKGE